MTAETDPEVMYDHFMSPSYFRPEIVEIAKEWYETTTDQRRAYVTDKGPSPLPELIENLAQQGINEPVEIMELIMIASGKWFPEHKEE